MVNVVAQAGGHHGEGLQVRVVALQLACLQRQGKEGWPLPVSLPGSLRAVEPPLPLLGLS